MTMRSLAGLADVHTATGNRTPDGVDRVGLRRTLTLRLAGVTTSTMQNLPGSAERTANTDGTAQPHQPIRATATMREHARNPIDIHVGARVR